MIPTLTFLTLILTFGLMINAEEDSYFPQKQQSNDGPYPPSGQPESGPYPAAPPSQNPAPSPSSQYPQKPSQNPDSQTNNNNQYPQVPQNQPSAAPVRYQTFNFRPNGRFLVQPVARVQVPVQSQPQQNYGPPPPASPSIRSTTTPVPTQEIEESTTTEDIMEQTPPPKAEAEAENIDQSSASEQQQVLDSGSYYVLLEDGRLQQVTYVTMPLKETAERLQAASINQPRPGGFVANIKYQDIEPIRGPIYTYNTAPLIQIYKK